MTGIVLVTGAAGFIGSHVVRELLADGRNVRATARAPEKAGFLNDLPIGEGGSLEIVKMDLMDSESVNPAVAGCADVIHCAAALFVGVKNAQRDVVDPSVTGTRHMTEAIDKAGTVKRIVHTSSVAAIRSVDFDDGQVFSNRDWCEDATIKSDAYSLAKAEAERLIRDWWAESSSEDRPRLVTIHPSIVLGPVMAERHMEGSMSFLDHFLKGFPPFVLKVNINMVDVRDVAIAHIRALDHGTDGGRHITHAGSLWMKDMGGVLRKGIPERKWARRLLPRSLTYVLAIFHPKITFQWVRKNVGTRCEFDPGDAEKELGFSFRPKEDTIVQAARDVLSKGWR